MPSGKSDKKELELESDEKEVLEEEHGGLSARTIRQEKAKRAPQGQTKGGLAQKVKVSRGFQRSSQQPKIKIIDKTNKDR